MRFLDRLSGCAQRENDREPAGRIWMTGFYKQPVEGAVWLGRLGLEGDGHADLEHHGGYEKAVLAYSNCHYPFWKKTFAMDPVFGGFGENFTIDELEENLVCIGDVYRVGEAQLQVSQPRRPCWKLSKRWQVRDLALHVQNSGKTGWYFRVLMEGCVQSGASFELIKRPNPEWTIAIVNEIMYH